MPKPSAFMVRLQENQRHNMHLQRLFTIQQCEDMAVTKANIDHKLERIMGDGFLPWEKRYPPEVFR